MAKTDKSALSVKPGVSNTESLNPHLAKRIYKKKNIDATAFLKGIRESDITILSKAITLIESTKPADKVLAQQVISLCLPLSGKSMRIGITGVPGAGKSTFIESFGHFLIHKKNKKIAVLAIDPSSNKTGGSILGDKTRMELLTQEKNAFIRPSPSAGTLGGVARKTRETIILCEAAGFDTILIETVGVGQSETAVKSMVDFFMLLLISGAGDELQGMKRGIMEMADGIWINKADGDNLTKAKLAASEIKRALHLFPADNRNWTIPTDVCSALEKIGLEEIWKTIKAFKSQMTESGVFNENRKNQAGSWLNDTIEEGLMNSFYENSNVNAQYNTLLEKVKSLKTSPFNAAQQLLNIFKNQ